MSATAWPRWWGWIKTSVLLVTLPVWLPLLALVGLVAKLVFWGIVRWDVWRPVESAWSKCADVWLRENWVWVASMGGGFSHDLMPALAKTHRRKRAFFLGKTQSPEAVLAAYACLCLYQSGGFRLDEVPEWVSQRRDTMPVRCGDMIDEHPLGSFLGGLAAHGVP